MHCKSYSHFFSKEFQHICISLDVNFNESLTNDVVSLEQLGPDIFIVPAFSMAQYRDPVFCLFICPSFISLSVFASTLFDPQVHFPRTVKATVRILGISLHLGMTTQTAVFIFDLYLYFVVHQLCKFMRNIALVVC